MQIDFIAAVVIGILFRNVWLCIWIMSGYPNALLPISLLSRCELVQ